MSKNKKAKWIRSLDEEAIFELVDNHEKAIKEIADDRKAVNLCDKTYEAELKQLVEWPDYVCSNCGEALDCNPCTGIWFTPFCPWCGSEMENGVKEDE